MLSFPGVVASRLWCSKTKLRWRCTCLCDVIRVMCVCVCVCVCCSFASGAPCKTLVEPKRCVFVSAKSCRGQRSTPRESCDHQKEPTKTSNSWMLSGGSLILRTWYHEVVASSVASWLAWGNSESVKGLNYFFGGVDLFPGISCPFLKAIKCAKSNVFA